MVLAAEEFESCEVDTNCEDGLKALACVFINTCEVLTKMYGGFFRTFYVAPEANSMHVDPFWSMCAQLAGQNRTLLEQDITILSTTIEAPTTASSNKRKSSLVKRMQQQNKLARIVPYSANDCNSVARHRFEADLLWQQERTSATQVRQYRVGYAMGTSKVARIYSFFLNMYNPTGGNLSDVRCAELVFSWYIPDRCDSVPLYLCHKLELLKLKPTVNCLTSKTSYKIAGKCTGPEGSFVQDDLSIAFVMSVSLCEDIHRGTHRGSFVRLEPCVPTSQADFQRDLKCCNESASTVEERAPNIGLLESNMTDILYSVPEDEAYGEAAQIDLHRGPSPPPPPPPSSSVNSSMCTP